MESDLPSRVVGAIADEQDRIPDRLWHYTSVSTLMKIATSRSIRLHSFEKMNDYMEGRWAAEKIQSRTYPIAGFEQFLLKQRRVDQTIFAFCLSASGDILSQWRGYGDAAQGVAIQFDGGKLQSLGFETPSATMPSLLGRKFIWQVLYCEETQDGMLHRIGNGLEEARIRSREARDRIPIPDDPSAQAHGDRSQNEFLFYETYESNCSPPPLTMNSP